MALRQTVEIEGKVFIQTPTLNVENGTDKISFSAYVKVESLVGTKNEMNADVSFSGESARFSRQYTFPVSVEEGSGNFIKQAYDYLKTLPEFADAVDC